MLPPWAAVAGLWALAACGAGSAFRGAGLALRLANTRLRRQPFGLVLFLGGRHFCRSSFLRQSRVMTFMPLSAATSKSFLKKRLEKVALPIPAWLAGDRAQSQFGDELSVGCGEKQNVFLDHPNLRSGRSLSHHRRCGLRSMALGSTAYDSISHALVLTHQCPG